MEKLIRLKHYLSDSKGAGKETSTNSSAQDLRPAGQSWDRVGEYTYVRRIAEKNPFKARGCGLKLWDSPHELEEVLFFDTETTGLSGGAGTLVFLIGMAWIEGKTIILEQVFLADYPGEAEFLAYISGRLKRDRLYVSYNGKCFDSHILKTRYLMNRMELGMPYQFDLLYPARRFWKRIVGACNLNNIEREILGVTREGDIPGSQIPDIYFDFLKTGNTDSLELVLEHNCRDVLSLVKLLNHLESILADPFVDLPIDRAALGLFFLNRADERGIKILESAQDAGDNRAGQTMAGYYKMKKCWPDAVAIWEKMAERKNIYAITELAKYYEHRSTDLETALRWVDTIPLNLTGRKQRAEIRKRRERLKRKISKKIY